MVTLGCFCSDLLTSSEFYGERTGTLTSRHDVYNLHKSASCLFPTVHNMATFIPSDEAYDAVFRHWSYVNIGGRSLLWSHMEALFVGSLFMTLSFVSIPPNSGWCCWRIHVSCDPGLSRGEIDGTLIISACLASSTQLCIILYWSSLDDTCLFVIRLSGDCPSVSVDDRVSGEDGWSLLVMHNAGLFHFFGHLILLDTDLWPC